MVNVFASWCIPCRDEHPVLEALKQQTGVPLSASTRRTRPKTPRRSSPQLGNPYDAVGADSDGRASIDWGVYGVPETFIVDAKGVIRFKHTGPLEPRSDIDREIVPAIARAKAEGCSASCTERRGRHRRRFSSTPTEESHANPAPRHPHRHEGLRQPATTTIGKIDDLQILRERDRSGRRAGRHRRHRPAANAARPILEQHRRSLRQGRAARGAARPAADARATSGSTPRACSAKDRYILPEPDRVDQRRRGRCSTSTRTS